MHIANCGKHYFGTRSGTLSGWHRETHFTYDSVSDSKLRLLLSGCRYTAYIGRGSPSCVEMWLRCRYIQGSGVYSET